MNRRGFLGSLLATVASIAAADVPTLLWSPSPRFDAPTLVPGSIVGMEAMTTYLVRAIAAAGITGEVLDAEGPLSLGQRGLTHQFGVDFEAPPKLDRYGLDAEQWLDPIALRLIQQCERLRVTKFGALPLPMDIGQSSRATHLRSGVSVRGLMGLGPDLLPLVRFDMVVG